MNILYRPALLLLPLIFAACRQSSPKENPLDQYADAVKPRPFAPELALKENTYKGSLTADGSTFYFFRATGQGQEQYRIYQSVYKNKTWSEPVPISFSDTSSDLYPLLSLAEKDRLILASYRRHPADTGKKANATFWHTEKNTSGEWAPPKPFPANSLLYNYNSQPSMTKRGTIYFTSTLPDWSQRFTYKMEYRNGSYHEPVLVDFINSLRQTDTARQYWETCISPDEDYMVLVISEKQESPKLFLSLAQADGWTSPRYIGEITGTDMSGNFPYITPDGKFLVFTKAFSGFYILPTKLFLP